ncbi:ROK family protein [Leuconostocaceae bacterium ESL0958]|nr:ROK family protein [Leuconostocaceae bacterium ESL0958]
MGLLGAIEAGGTKFVLAVANQQFDILDRQVIATADGETTLNQVIAYFDQFQNIDAIGIAAFGPIDLKPMSPTYGRVLDTPKRGWSGYDFLGRLKAWRNIPYYWTTDVNGAAWAEYQTGAGAHCQQLAYLTVGTGIGAGLITDGRLLTGYGHPEVGHMVVQKHPQDQYQGHCPFHGDQCLEGLAAGPAIEARFGQSAKDLPADHLAWVLEADYLAQAAVNLTMMLRPEVIVFGGGVAHQPQLLAMIRTAFATRFADYLATPPLDQYLVAVKNGDNAGILGCFYLAQEALK